MKTLTNEQILALAEKYKLAHKFPEGWVAFEGTTDNLVACISGAIESYKAELLKEVGKPVACVDKRDWDWHLINSPETSIGIWPTSDWKRKLNLPYQVPMFFYTSDQVAAAILKATKPLEEEVAKFKEGWREAFNAGLQHQEAASELRAQLAAAQEEIKTVTDQKNRMWFETQTAQDQLATAEQRVAEACAELSASQDNYITYNAIRSGEWRKFLKE